MGIGYLSAVAASLMMECPLFENWSDFLRLWFFGAVLGFYAMTSLCIILLSTEKKREYHQLTP